MKTSDLKVLFVVDAVRGRNGVGSYFDDLVSAIKPKVAAVELVAPSLDAPHDCQGGSMPMPGDPTQRLFFPRLRQLTGFIERFQPHVIVVPGPGLFSLAAFWLGARLGIPVCVTHQTDYDSLVALYWRGWMAAVGKTLVRWMNRLMFRRSAAVVTISADMQAQLRQLGIAGSRLVGTPLASEFVEVPVVPPRAAIRRVLFVGRLAAEKNLHHVLALAANRPDLQFTIVGDGPQREKVRRHCARYTNLTFLGWCSRQAVREQVDAHDVLVLPSAVEAFGTVALEGMSRQRLVMTTASCGISAWPALAAGLHVLAPGESLAMGLKRLEQLPEAERAQLRQAALAGARAVHGDTVSDWLQVLQASARLGGRLPRPSPTRALLRRLAAPPAP